VSVSTRDEARELENGRLTCVDSAVPDEVPLCLLLTEVHSITAAREAFGRGERGLVCRGRPRVALSPAALCVGARLETWVLAWPARTDPANPTLVKGPLEHTRDSQLPKNGDSARQC
jgi:hypothetical protein